MITYLKGGLEPNEQPPDKRVELPLTDVVGGVAHTLAELFGGQGTFFERR